MTSLLAPRRSPSPLGSNLPLIEEGGRVTGTSAGRGRRMTNIAGEKISNRENFC
jgi:hypothetical protein